jgi:hypothetical protein
MINHKHEGGKHKINIHIHFRVLFLTWECGNTSMEHVRHPPDFRKRHGKRGIET